MTMTAMPAGIAGTALALMLAPSLWSTGVAGQELPQSSLEATDDSGLPSDVAGDWMAAEGEATVVEQQGGQDVIEVEASNLVPDGLYTVWWVNEATLGMDMGPGAEPPGNEFRADADGNATTTFEVPSDNDYQMMVVAYHADDQTHGDSPGEMSETAFSHLMGPWPGPAGEMPE
ncbi:MAG: hypothetical protein ACFCVH_03790 [Alphaproteobacteria bacterium]